jgi:hypothetical protein
MAHRAATTLTTTKPRLIVTNLDNFRRDAIWKGNDLAKVGLHARIRCRLGAGRRFFTVSMF